MMSIALFNCLSYDCSAIKNNVNLKSKKYGNSL
ncbi:MAG: hypothetical protein ACI9M1_001307 [Porticoccaceae bacterium]